MLNQIKNKLIQKTLLWKTNFDYFFEFHKQSKITKTFPVFQYQPLISIILPVYNPPEIYLKKCLDSVINQTYPHWELCIVDDCSPNPHIQQIILNYAQKYPNIKYLFRNTNGHISRTSNDAIKLSTGEFVALLDHDDEIAPYALSSIVNVLNQYPQTDFIYSDEDKINSLGIHCDPSFKFDFAFDQLLSNNYICHLSVFRKSLINKIGGFRIGYEGSQDYDLILRVAEETKKIIHIPNVLYHWRKIPGSTASTYSTKSYANQASINALTDYLTRNKIKGTVTNGLKLGTFRIKYEISGKPLVSIITKNKSLLLDNLTSYKNIEICFSPHIAKGEYLLFINKPLRPLTSDWIERLLEHAQRPNIGIVFPKILFPNGTIANQNFYGLPDSINQPFPSLNAKDIINNFDTYSPECFMIAKNKYKKAGLRNLYTPYSIVSLPY